MSRERRQSPSNGGLEERLRLALGRRADRVVPAEPDWQRVAARLAARRARRHRLALSGVGAAVAAAACAAALVAVEVPGKGGLRVVSPAASPASTARGSRSAGGTRFSPTTGAGHRARVAGPVPGPAGGPVPAAFQPASSTWISARQGWALGTAPCAKPPCTSLLRTFDAGATWQGVPAPVDALASSPYAASGVSRVRFADPVDGWAFGPDLWATHDGGKTWHRVHLGGRVVDLEAAAGRAYAVVEAASGAALLYSTPVAADSWRPLASPEPLSADATIALSGSSGYVLGAGGTVLSIGPSELTLRGAPCPVGSTPVALGPTTRRLYALCASNPAAGSAAKEVVASGDQAGSWSPAGHPPLPGMPSALAAASGGAIVVAATGGSSLLYRSTDGGARWATVYASPGGAPFTDLGFTDARQGIAVLGEAGHGSVLLMTFDGGATWSPVRF